MDFRVDGGGGTRASPREFVWEAEENKGSIRRKYSCLAEDGGGEGHERPGELGTKVPVHETFLEAWRKRPRKLERTWRSDSNRGT